MNFESWFLAIIAICVSAEIAPIPCVNDASCQGIIPRAGETGKNGTIVLVYLAGSAILVSIILVFVSFCELININD